MSHPTVPSHWVPYISDSGWYSLSHPPTWQAERRDQWLILHAPQEEARLSFHCVQLVREPGMSAAQVDLASLLAQGAGLAKPRNSIFRTSTRASKVPPASSQAFSAG